VSAGGLAPTAGRASLPARAIARPVLDALGGEPVAGVVAGVARSAAYVHFDGFVVAVSGRRVPLMPNAVGLGWSAGAPRWPAPGRAVRLTRGRLDLGAGTAVTWDATRPPVWDAVPCLVAAATPVALAERGRGVLAACGVRADAGSTDLAAPLVGSGLAVAADRAGRLGLALLLGSVTARDPEMAARGAALLVGRGPGLTPEGDDLLAGAAAVIAVAGERADFDAAARAAWLRAVRRLDLRRLTTPLSATLLELATRGHVVEPVHGLLDFTAGGEARWTGALERLERIGHSTGRAYALATGATAVLLASSR